MNKLRIARETATSLKLDEGKEDIIRPSVPIFAVIWNKLGIYTLCINIEVF